MPDVPCPPPDDYAKCTCGGVLACIDRMDQERVNLTLDAVTRPLTEHLGTREMLKAVAQALLEGVAPFK
jgi:hypothetical protein